MVVLKKELGNLKNVGVHHYINEIKMSCQQSSGTWTCTIKNLFYFHLYNFIKIWGLPSSWDSALSESHHKTEIKASSKNTQKNVHTLIKQTAKAQLQNKMLMRGDNCKNNEAGTPKT